MSLAMQIGLPVFIIAVIMLLALLDSLIHNKPILKRPEKDKYSGKH